MFGGPKVKLDKDLLERCRKHAEEAGYTSLEEFITHTLEKELRKERTATPEDEEKVAKRLKGLGYIE
jgi:metal-responsive CopG/Arc/MetJ family transcriptional regulator